MGAQEGAPETEETRLLEGTFPRIDTTNYESHLMLSWRDVCYQSLNLIKNTNASMMRRLIFSLLKESGNVYALAEEHPVAQVNVIQTPLNHSLSYLSGCGDLKEKCPP